MFKHFHCEARRTRSAVEVQHVPSGHIPRSASSIRSFTQIRQKCSSIFNAKPTRPDQPLRFSMARFLTPCHPQRFIHQKLHQMPTKMLKHLQREAHQTRSAVEVQHGSFPHTMSPAALHPSEASPNANKMLNHLQREAPRTISAADVQHGSFPHTMLPAALHPSEASPNANKMLNHLQREAPRTISAADVQHGSSHIRTLLAQPHGLPVESKPYRH